MPPHELRPLCRIDRDPLGCYRLFEEEGNTKARNLSDVALAQQAQDHGLTVRALSRYAIARKDLRGLVIGYGYAPLEAIQKDGPVLAQLVLRALRHRHA